MGVLLLLLLYCDDDEEVGVSVRRLCFLNERCWDSGLN